MSARSSPVITISRVDLPDPDGPSSADRLAAPYIEVDVLEDMNAGRAPPERQIDAAQRHRRAGRTPEVSCMLLSQSILPASPAAGAFG